MIIKAFIFVWDSYLCIVAFWLCFCLIGGNRFYFWQWQVLITTRKIVYSLSEGNTKLILLYHGLHSLCLCSLFTKNFIDAINALSSLMPSASPMLNTASQRNYFMCNLIKYFRETFVQIFLLKRWNMVKEIFL